MMRRHVAVVAFCLVGLFLSAFAEPDGCRVETKDAGSPQGVTARRTVVRNVGAAAVALTNLTDRWTFEGDGWEVYTQTNSWQHESVGRWRPLKDVVETRATGLRTCDGATPMLAVWNPKANEGHVFYVISDGMWLLRAVRETPIRIRVEAGYDPRQFHRPLASGERIELPEVLTHTFTNRLDLDCHKLHAYWNARHPARAKTLPAIYNTWLCRFDKLELDFLLKQVARAKEIGFDYFVVDAGWFGPKANWGSVRGDWEERPDGWLGGRLGEVSKAVRAAGMKFGFWVEPECASSGANVVKAHPDWFLKVGGQYFLDFRKPAAFNGILETVCGLVKRYEASFLKFDFNQTEADDPGGRGWSDYNAAYRRFVEHVRTRNPGIRIEGCASGGFMMDLNWSRTFDGFWLSDNQSLYDGVRIVKDTMLRLPPRCIERWLTLRRLNGIQPDYNGGDSRLLTTEDAMWLNVRSVPLSRVDGFVAGGPFCMSCDLTTFDDGDVRYFRELIAKIRGDSAFWQTAVGRILVDTPEVTVLQFSDEKLTDVRIFAITQDSSEHRLNVRPAVSFAVGDVEVVAPACGGVREVRLRKVRDGDSDLQALLDKGGEVRFPAGEFTVDKTLVVRPGTHLVCEKGFRARLKDGANCAILANRDAKTNLVADISVEGGVWDGNNEHQDRSKYSEAGFTPPLRYGARKYGQLIVFSGVRGLRLKGLTVKDPQGFSIMLTDVEDFAVEDITFDCNDRTVNEDGVHVNGFARHGVIRGIRGHTNDDLVALNSDEGDFRTGDCTIEDVLIEDLDGCARGYTGVRLLSRHARVRDVTIRNVRGRFQFNVVSFTHWAGKNYRPGMGHFDNVLIEDITATSCRKEGGGHGGLIWFQEGVQDVGKVTVRRLRREEGAEYRNTVPTIEIGEDARIRELRLEDVSQKLPDDRPLIRRAPSSEVRIVRGRPGEGR